MKELNANDLDQVAGGFAGLYLAECTKCHKNNVPMRPGEDKKPICEECKIKYEGDKIERPSHPSGIIPPPPRN